MIRQYISTFGLFAFIFGFATTSLAQSKKVVCSITINSNDEREFFKAKLPPGNYEFKELVPQVPHSQNSPYNWLESSCSENLKCDVLLVSGHFNGVSFFGDAKYELTLEQMEQMSCMKKCGGIFRAPKEVYLMGCNTLSGKDKDTRTPEQYYRALLDHHVGETDAQQAVALRYSPLGNSSNERMQRVFAGVPRIYGYSSKSPLGSYNKLVLPKLFDLFGDYATHLNHVETEKNILLETGRAPNLSQSDWLTVMAGKNPTNCSGSLPADSNLGLICHTHNTELPIGERLKSLIALLNGPEGTKFILVAHAFLEKNIKYIDTQETLAQLAEIKNNEKIRSTVFNLLPVFEKSPNVRIDLVELAYLVGWFNFQEFEEAAAYPAQKLFEQQATYDNQKTICSYDKYFGKQLKYNLNGLRSERFHNSFYETSSGLRAMGCIRIGGTAHMNRLFQMAQNESHPLRYEILSTLGASEAKSPEIQRFFYNLTYSENPELVRLALLGIVAVGSIQNEVTTRLLELKNHPNIIIREQAESTYNYQVRAGLIKPSLLGH